MRFGLDFLCQAPFTRSVVGPIGWRGGDEGFQPGQPRRLRLPALCHHHRAAKAPGRHRRGGSWQSGSAARISLTVPPCVPHHHGEAVMRGLLALFRETESTLIQRDSTTGMVRTISAAGRAACDLRSAGSDCPLEGVPGDVPPAFPHCGGGAGVDGA